MYTPEPPIQWTPNTIRGKAGVPFAPITQENIRRARSFHASLPGYSPSPLYSLKKLAGQLGLRDIVVKDESTRFGLGAFKVLGASYAISRAVAERLGCSQEPFSFDALCSPAVRAKLGAITFFAATDGNHGAAVAWTAKQLGQHTVILMPKGSSAARTENIRRFGAEVHVTELNYDDTVRLAAKKAEEVGGILVQDTGWAGYQTIPRWVLEGYSTLAAEALEQLSDPPTHVFLQAGVGAFAAGVQGCFSALLGSAAPIATVVEAAAADCFFRSVKAGDGHRHPVTGSLFTLMAGLACGEANPEAFELLKEQASFFVSCPDWVTAYGMRILGNPLLGDPRIIAGESGAVGMGLLMCLMENPALAPLREAMKLDRHARVLLISTEGNTDPAAYQDIVWRNRNTY